MHEFFFNIKEDKTILLGQKARTLSDILTRIQAVPESSIYYHTHKYIEQHYFLSPEPTNDIAYWVKLGENGNEHIKNNFLITRRIKDYLLLFIFLFHQGKVVNL